MVSPWGLAGDSLGMGAVDRSWRGWFYDSQLLRGGGYYGVDGWMGAGMGVKGLRAHRKRSDLMGDLVTLYPAILHLGGEGAMRGIVAEMKRVCGQWP